MRQDIDLEQVFANADLGRIATALEGIRAALEARQQPVDWAYDWDPDKTEYLIAEHEDEAPDDDFYELEAAGYTWLGVAKGEEHIHIFRRGEPTLLRRPRQQPAGIQAAIEAHNAPRQQPAPSQDDAPETYTQALEGVIHDALKDIRFGLLLDAEKRLWKAMFPADEWYPHINPRQQPAASGAGDDAQQYTGRIIPADAPERETVRIWTVEEIRVAIHNVRDLVPPDVQSHSDAYCDGYFDAIRHAITNLRADLIGGGPEPDATEDDGFLIQDWDDD